MAVQIEILEQSGTEVRTAFYYPVPPQQYLPGSDDQTRVPEGTVLSPAEIQDIKDGRLYEYVKIFPARNLTSQQIRDKLVTRYPIERTDAAAKYRELYSSLGSWYDGTSWN